MMARLRSKAWLHRPSLTKTFQGYSRMLVNFLHPFFKSRVDCDVVSSDGYSVGNLISMDFRESSRGFLAAHFIKPPALLLFQLPFPIHVESMIIKPKVGSQISSGLAIMVAGIAAKRDPFGKEDTSNNKSTQLLKNKRTKKQLLSDSNKVENSQQGSAVCCQKRLEKETSIHIPNHSYELDITPGSAKDEHAQFFSQVAWLNDREGKTIHIQNKLFQQRSPVQGFYPATRSDFQEGEFQRPYLLQKVTHVALKIARLSGSSVPAIGKVEIWGQPSAACKPGVLEYALGIQEKIQAGAAVKTTAIINRTTENSKNDTLSSYSSSSLPEDFIDPITCELMTVPVLLPSGHNIDTTTLEKHITAERSWGRLPSDPFTGKVFSDTSKPVPNSALKVRIDKFLLTSGVSTSSWGRTVGRENSLSRASSLNDSPLLKTNINTASESNKSVHCDSKEFRKQSDSNSSLDISEQTGAELGHEEAVSRSLDSALHQTLRGLHMFTRNMTGSKEVPTLTQASITQTKTGLQGRLKRAAPLSSETLRNQIKKKKSTVLCVMCGRDLSTESIFHLPCQHVMCRSCLMIATQEKTSGNTCKLCKTKFRQMDVTRVHNM